MAVKVMNSTIKQSDTRSMSTDVRFFAPPIWELNEDRHATVKHTQDIFKPVNDLTNCFTVHLSEACRMHHWMPSIQRMGGQLINDLMNPVQTLQKKGIDPLQNPSREINSSKSFQKDCPHADLDNSGCECNLCGILCCIAIKFHFVGNHDMHS